MRVWIAALYLAAATAGRAQAGPLHGTLPDDAASDFWRDVIEPHAATVAAIVVRARAAIGRVAESSDGEPAVYRRERYLHDAYAMLRRARALSPDNPEVLGLVGYAADELGKTHEALDALEACARIEGPERAGAEVTGRLGMIYLRLGRFDDAIRWLRYAQGPIAAADHAVAAVHLATALAARGQMSSAIDTLTNALPAQTNYFTDPVTLVSFALAVHYDRDEQRGAAFDVLDRMQVALQQELGPLAGRALAAMRYAPAEDQYYYQALLDEALGAYAEARAEWALYASVTDAPWRRRALDHIAGLDALRAAPAARHDGASSLRAIHHKLAVP